MNKSLDPKTLQAFADGELAEDEAHRVEQMLDQDAEGRQLVQELHTLGNLLQPENELPHRPTDTPEFFWSQVRRQIEAEENQARADVRSRWSWWRQWLRYAVPVAGAAAVAAGIWLVRTPSGESDGPRSPRIAELPHNAVPDVNTISFYAEAGEIAVVWISDDEITYLP